MYCKDKYVGPKNINLDEPKMKLAVEQWKMLAINKFQRVMKRNIYVVNYTKKKIDQMTFLHFLQSPKL